MTVLWCLLTAAVITGLVANGQTAPRPLRDGSTCEVRARLQAGWVCGVKRVVHNRTAFASFLGVPYAAQPLAERRFSELEPVEHWDDFYDATYVGPVCPQQDLFYGELMDTTNMSEACIYANIHVPIHALPSYSIPAYSKEYQPPTGLVDKEEASTAPGLPILVFIHGGGFAFGSSGTDVYGPEYMMHKDVIVITFNYRLNVFGYLSLNSSSVPGNNGLRDAVTLLRWVQANARRLGGDPGDVTIGGQSAGAVMTHLLTLSKAAEGLFRRAILMSGVGTYSFYTSSPVYAQYVASVLLTELRINATDPEVIHQQLIKTPLQDIMDANRRLQDMTGMAVFVPVVESPFPGVTTILDSDPDILLSKGIGKDISLVIGFTDNECQTFRPRFEEIDILDRIKTNPMLIISPNLSFKVPPKVALDLANKTIKRYFNEEPTMDKYLKACSDSSFIYPAIKLAEQRAAQGGAPVFLYEYSYTADFSPIREARGLKYKGAGHLDDMLFVFRANSMDGIEGFSPPTRKDQLMVEWMTKFVRNFMYCKDPACNLLKWPPLEKTATALHYQKIERPLYYRYAEISKDLQEMVQFFDRLHNATRL